MVIIIVVIITILQKNLHKNLQTYIYCSYVVYEVIVTSDQQAQQVYALENQLNLDMWSYATPARPGLVLVPGSKRQQFQNAVHALGAQYQIQTENIKEWVAFRRKLSLVI